jgi:hypothetical protein
MPTESSHTPDKPPPAIVGPPTTSAQKGAATVLRHKEERRAESLRNIQRQTSDGTLVVRQMTAEQRDAASQVAHRVRETNDTRERRYRSPEDGDT